jgi:hypothetical protein
MARNVSKQGEALVVPIKVLWAQAEPATSNLAGKPSQSRSGVSPGQRLVIIMRCAKSERHF